MNEESSVNLLDFPQEIIENIFISCDLQSLSAISRTCSLLKSLVYSEIIWKTKWKEIGGLREFSCFPNSNNNIKCYRDACRRYMKTYHGTNMKHNCCKCKKTESSAEHSKKWTNQFVFDFGGKTAWLKCQFVNRTNTMTHPTLVAHPKVPALKEAGDGNRNSRPECLFCKSSIGHEQWSFPDGFWDLMDPLPTAPTALLQDIIRIDLNEEQSHSSEEEAEEEGLDDFRIGAHGGLPYRSSRMVSRDLDYFDEVSAMTHHLNPKCPFIVRSPFRDGAVDLRDLAFLMHHMLLKADVSAFDIQATPVIFCLPHGCRDATLIFQLLSMFFETLKIPKIYLVDKAVSTSLYAGLETCLIVDSGAYNTYVSPVINHKVQYGRTAHRPVGGFYISKSLVDYLNSAGRESKIAVASLDTCRVKKECYLVYNSEKETKKSKIKKTLYVRTLSDDGQSSQELCDVQLSHELYLAAEHMYVALDLPTMISSSLRGLEPHIRNQLLANIVLTGGNSKLNGFNHRLCKDLKQVFPQQHEMIRVRDPRGMLGRCDAVIGASFVNKLEYLPWLTREDYIIYGEDLVDVWKESVVS